LSTCEKDITPEASATRTRSPTRTSDMNLEPPDSRVTLSDPAKQVDFVAVSVVVVCGMVGTGGKEGDGTDSVGADPDGTDTEGADPDGADTVGADPDGADTAGAVPDGTDTEGADPDGADSEGADPDGADSEGAGAVGSPRAADGGADLVAVGSPRAADGGADLVAVGGFRVGTAATGFMVGDAPSDPLIATIFMNGDMPPSTHSSELKSAVVTSPVQSKDALFVVLSTYNDRVIVDPEESKYRLIDFVSAVDSKF
jgi:hypothetical protein